MGNEKWKMIGFRERPLNLRHWRVRARGVMARIAQVTPGDLRERRLEVAGAHAPMPEV